MTAGYLTVYELLGDVVPDTKKFHDGVRAVLHCGGTPAPPLLSPLRRKSNMVDCVGNITCSQHALTKRMKSSQLRGFTSAQ
jgi:hypothetical protein